MRSFIIYLTFSFFRDNVTLTKFVSKCELQKKFYNEILLKIWTNPCLFLFICIHVLFQYQLQFQNYKLKKHRWCAWDSNPGLQVGRRRWNHGAMAAARMKYYSESSRALMRATFEVTAERQINPLWFLMNGCYVSSLLPKKLVTTGVIRWAEQLLSVWWIAP